MSLPQTHERRALEMFFWVAEQSVNNETNAASNRKQWARGPNGHPPRAANAARTKAHPSIGPPFAAFKATHLRFILPSASPISSAVKLIAVLFKRRK